MVSKYVSGESRCSVFEVFQNGFRWGPTLQNHKKLEGSLETVGLFMSIVFNPE